MDNIDYIIDQQFRWSQREEIKMEDFAPALDSSCRDCGQFILEEDGTCLHEFGSLLEQDWDEEKGSYGVVRFFHANCSGNTDSNSDCYRFGGSNVQ